jgi:hypothetical protein
MREWASEVGWVSMRSLAARIPRKPFSSRELSGSRPPSSRKQAIKHIHSSPGRLVPWIDLIGLLKVLKADFPPSLREQVDSRDLTSNGVILCFKDELQDRKVSDLQPASGQLDHEAAVSVSGDVMAGMIRLITIAQHSDAEAEGNYYRNVEPYREKQWEGVFRYGDWAHNPGNRCAMTAEWMRGSSAAAGLDVVFHRLSGLADGWGQEDLEAFTVLHRHALA